MVTTTPNTTIQTTQTQITNTDSTFNLPTEKVDNVVDKTINTINNLSTPNKIIVGSVVGLATLSFVGFILWCCCRRRGRTIFGRRRQMEISYPVVPQSPTLRRRR